MCKGINRAITITNMPTWLTMLSIHLPFVADDDNLDHYSVSLGKTRSQHLSGDGCNNCKLGCFRALTVSFLAIPTFCLKARPSTDGSLYFHPTLNSFWSNFTLLVNRRSTRYGAVYPATSVMYQSDFWRVVIDFD